MPDFTTIYTNEWKTNFKNLPARALKFGIVIPKVLDPIVHQDLRTATIKEIIRKVWEKEGGTLEELEEEYKKMEEEEKKKEKMEAEKKKKEKEKVEKKKKEKEPEEPKASSSKEDPEEEEPEEEKPEKIKYLKVKEYRKFDDSYFINTILNGYRSVKLLYGRITKNENLKKQAIDFLYRHPEYEKKIEEILLIGDKKDENHKETLDNIAFILNDEYIDTINTPDINEMAKIITTSYLKGEIDKETYDNLQMKLQKKSNKKISFDKKFTYSKLPDYEKIPQMYI